MTIKKSVAKAMGMMFGESEGWLIPIIIGGNEDCPMVLSRRMWMVRSDHDPPSGEGTSITISHADLPAILASLVRRDHRGIDRMVNAVIPGDNIQHGFMASFVGAAFFPKGGTDDFVRRYESEILMPSLDTAQPRIDRSIALEMDADGYECRSMVLLWRNPCQEEEEDVSP